MENGERARKIQKIIAKAWMDEGFKQRLLSDPAAGLKEAGMETLPGIEFRIVADTDKVRHLVIPPKPSSLELSDETLQGIAAGIDFSHCTAKYCL